jgi:hypothetical protein
MANVEDIKITLKLSHVIVVAGTLICGAATATAGYISLKSDIAEAKYEASTLSKRVARIECLMYQQTQFQIYGLKPTRACD